MSIFKGIERAGSGPKATSKQLEYITSLCEQLGDLDRLVELDEKLTVGEASEMIEDLKEEAADQEPDDYGWSR